MLIKIILIFIHRNKYPKDKIVVYCARQKKSRRMKGIYIGTINSFHFVVCTRQKKKVAQSNSSEMKPILPTR